jgi:hypothetical protein
VIPQQYGEILIDNAAGCSRRLRPHIDADDVAEGRTDLRAVQHDVTGCATVADEHDPCGPET